MTNTAHINREVVIHLIEALKSCDETVIRELVHPTVEWCIAGLGSKDFNTLISRARQMLGAGNVSESTITGTTAEGERVPVDSRENSSSNCRRFARLCTEVARSTGVGRQLCSCP